MDDELVIIFMTDEFQECHLSVIVHSKPTLCVPPTSALKYGIKVSVSNILNSNDLFNSFKYGIKVSGSNILNSNDLFNSC